MPATRWAILGTGRISQDFALCINNLPNEEHVLKAVGARSLQTAQAFADKYNIPKAYGSYDEVCEDKDVDVFYIGTVNPNHYIYGLKLVKNGRNVLSEKPFGMNSRQTKEVVETAKKNNVFFMEGFWSRFFPVYKELRKSLSDGTIGKPLVVTCTFGITATEVQRLNDPKLGGSATLDLGCYLVQLALLVFGEKPIKITASGHLFESGVDKTTSFTLLFKDGGVANLICTCTVWLENTARIVGTNGTIEFGVFHAPTEMKTPSGKKAFKLPQLDRKPVFENSEGLCYEAQAVREAILAGKNEHEFISHDESVRIAEVLEEILNQVGVTFYKDL